MHHWDKAPEHRGRPGCTSAAPIEGMLSYCTWAQDVASTKAQKEMRLISGPKHGLQGNAKNHRHAPEGCIRKEEGGGGVGLDPPPPMVCAEGAEKISWPQFCCAEGTEEKFGLATMEAGP
mmetsp:Transcript_32773/g.53527  ORF Transcript_32773/g.53527 Transcript_32773/m.53527 type:complete len:120 (-) Transcript_32773:46-405(-)